MHARAACLTIFRSPVTTLSTSPLDTAITSGKVPIYSKVKIIIRCKLNSNSLSLSPKATKIPLAPMTNNPTVFQPVCSTLCFTGFVLILFQFEISTLCNYISDRPRGFKIDIIWPSWEMSSSKALCDLQHSLGVDACQRRRRGS